MVFHPIYYYNIWFWVIPSFIVWQYTSSYISKYLFRNRSDIAERTRRWATFRSNLVFGQAPRMCGRYSTILFSLHNLFLQCQLPFTLRPPVPRLDITLVDAFIALVYSPLDKPPYIYNIKYNYKYDIYIQIISFNLQYKKKKTKITITF